MKHLLTIISLMFTLSFTYAQYDLNAPWMTSFKDSKTDMDKVKFYDVVKAFNKYWEGKDYTKRGSGFKPFKRWEYYWKNFVKEDGTLPNRTELWQGYLDFEKLKSRSSLIATDLSSWNPIGPYSHINTGSWTPGQGRINVVVKSPTDSNIYYAGAPSGGFWKSTDNGVTWKTTTDHLPQIGVSGIAVDPNNSNIIYIATGDDDHVSSYSVGVLKSTDGGVNWVTTGLNVAASPSSMNDIYVNPTNSQEVWVATNQGVYKSVNAGVNWTNVNNTQGGNIRDLKLKPGNSSVLYAVSSSRFYKSTDGGDTFVVKGTGLPLTDVSRIVIDVTKANPEVVYASVANGAHGFKGIYKSVDSGETFVEVANPVSNGDIFEVNQSWYDLSLAVSDTDENVFYNGVLNLWKGVVDPLNNTSVLTKLNDWFQPTLPLQSTYTHADIHYLRFFDGALLAGTDGGFYKSTDGGDTFIDLTKGMQIGQLYSISVSTNSANKMVGGLQDNGGFALKNTSWQNYYGSDGMETAIDPVNPNLIYGFIQQGSQLEVSLDGGTTNSYTAFSPVGEVGNWVTPLAISKRGALYSGFKKLYKLINKKWSAVTTTALPANISKITVDPVNDNVIYIAVNALLFRSDDAGVTFTQIKSFTQAITSIAVNTNDNNTVYVTTKNKIYRIAPDGTNEVEFSNGIPTNLAINIIAHQSVHPKNPLYVGTTLGVFKRDDDDAAWQLFDNGLPNVSVRDLAINTAENEIVAATYGRGVWKSKIQTESVLNDLELVKLENPEQSISCQSSFIPKVTFKNNGTAPITSATISLTINGVTQITNWNGNLSSNQVEEVLLPEQIFGRGNYNILVSGTTPNDVFMYNNTSVYSYKNIALNSVGTVNNTNGFQNSGEELLTGVLKGSSVWELGLPTGTILKDDLNPTNKVYGTNLDGDYSNNAISYLYSNCYNLTDIENPFVSFKMAYALETNRDVFYVETSIDNGASWQKLGTSTDLDWYNSSEDTSPICENCTGSQWTGTDSTIKTYQHSLTAFQGTASLIVRFVLITDGLNTEEGVILDDLTVGGKVILSTVDVDKDLENVVLAPNPTTGILFIKTNNENCLKTTVFGVSGQKVYSEVTLGVKTVELNLKNLESGMYFILLEQDGKQVTKKIIKL